MWYVKKTTTTIIPKTQFWPKNVTELDELIDESFLVLPNKIHAVTPGFFGTGTTLSSHEYSCTYK